MCEARRLEKVTSKGLLEPSLSSFMFLLIAARNKNKYHQVKKGLEVFGFADGSSLVFDLKNNTYQVRG